MQTVLITGASRGIGKALTEEFLRHEWHVFAAMRDPEKAPPLKNIPPPSNFEIIRLDVTSDDTVAAAVETVRKATDGKLQILINNAGIFPEDGKEHLAEMKLDWFRQAFETNVVAVVRMIQHFKPLLASGSRIVNISSGLGSISGKDDFEAYAYSVSKAALNMLTRSIAAEFAPEGIIVTAMSPGWVRTDMGGSHATLSPEESAHSLFRTITHLAQDHSGTFLGKDGSPSEYQW